MKFTSELITSINRLAWSLRKKRKGMTWGQALRAAWRALGTVKRLMAATATAPARFSFVKKDGSIREAEGYLPDETTSGDVRDLAASVIGGAVRYFDLSVGGWRSFRMDSLVTF